MIDAIQTIKPFSITGQAVCSLECTPPKKVAHADCRSYIVHVVPVYLTIIKKSFPPIIPKQPSPNFKMVTLFLLHSYYTPFVQFVSPFLEPKGDFHCYVKWSAQVSSVVPIAEDLTGDTVALTTREGFVP